MKNKEQFENSSPSDQIKIVNGMRIGFTHYVMDITLKESRVRSLGMNNLQ